MLHDVWGAKTHDLTYKPEAEFDSKLDKHMNILGDVLRLLDDQSEILKELIHDQWNFDKKERNSQEVSF
jgi:hypothetical protein